MGKLSEKVKNLFEGLSPKEKKVAVLAAVLFGLFFMMIVSYRMGGSKSIPVAKPAAQKNSAPLEPDLLGKSLYNEKERELRQRDEEMKSLKAEIDEIKKEKEGKEKSRAGSLYPPVPLPSVTPTTTMVNSASPPTYPSVPPPLPQQGQGPAKQAEPELVGDIDIIANPQAQDKPGIASGKVSNDKNDKKKGVEKIYLPPSFMPAVLLTGVRARTSGQGKGDPQPILFRITDLAVLPNRIKKDLKDCFVVANAMGDLSEERVDVRLDSLHCLARNGRVAVNQKVKGTVLDSDGVVNLDGKVVARWGSTLAASAYAGAFSGIGDALKAASTQTLMNASTTLQQIQPGNMLQGAAGSGAASAFSKISDFMLKIAEQTMPVVEVGNLKRCTVFITEGVDIEVKNYCGNLDSLGGATCSEDM